MTRPPRICPSCRRAGTVLIRYVEHAPPDHVARPYVMCSALCGWRDKMSDCEGDEDFLAHLPVEWRHEDGRLAGGPL